MKSTILSAAVAAMILAMTPMHAAAREQGLQPTAELQATQAGKSAEAVQPQQTKSARAKAIHRGYAIRARIAKQKTPLAKGKKRAAKARKRSVQVKKQAA
ncbi:MAG TPA: hypothetical protein VFW28_01140 [Micropepsaceae bacterium]|nr:hypothetical protein [Micropepsaceae bacterium]